MPSMTYNLVRQAIVNRQSVSAMFGDHQRDLTPHVIGLNKSGGEQALFFQFGGGSTSGLPPEGEWRCMPLDKLSNVRVRPDAGWHVGATDNTREQSCVVTVHLKSKFGH